MSYFDRVNKILEKSFEEINSSTLIIELLRLYSDLYLNGFQVSTCAKCHYDYYLKLKTNGVMKAIEKDKNKTTHVIKKKPNQRGDRLLYSTKCGHVNLDRMTDRDAVFLLENKILKEADFIKLPETYNPEREPIEKNETLAQPTIDTKSEPEPEFEVMQPKPKPRYKPRDQKRKK
jgi:hypothetical protein